MDIMSNQYTKQTQCIIDLINSENSDNALLGDANFNLEITAESSEPSTGGGDNQLGEEESGTESD